MIPCNKEETCQAPDAPSSVLSNFQGNLGKFSFEEMGEEKLHKNFCVIQGDPMVKGCSLHSQLMGSAPHTPQSLVGSLYLSYRALMNINICKTVRTGTRLLRKLKSC